MPSSRPRLLGVAGLACAGTLLLSGLPAHAADLPYTDPSSTGALSLCGADGAALTGGRLSPGPPASLAVGSSAAPEDYAGPGGTATLLAFQPRQGVDPAQWSGELVTGASRYTDPAHPAVRSVPADLSLAGFVADFPPSWDGLVQLRLYLGAPGQPVRSGKYDSADVRIVGDRWELVRGGSASCAGVRATPLAQLLGVPAVTPTTTTPPHPGAAAVTTIGAASPGPQGEAVADSSSRAQAPAAATSATHRWRWPLISLPLVGLGALAARRALRPKGTR